MESSDYDDHQQVQDLYIPIDIVSEILSRVPVPTVLRCRSVCKAWSRLTRTEFFIHQHLENFQKNETNYGSVDLGWRDEDGETVEYCSSQGHSRSLKSGLKMINWGSISTHCDGLVCVYNVDYDFTIAILNPVMDDDLIKLPDKGMTKYQVEDVRLCYDPHSNRYKVFRFFLWYNDDNIKHRTIGVEVLTLGDDDSWSYVGEAPDFYNNDTIIINGAIHWSANENNKIISLKIGDPEKITVIECPIRNTRTGHDYLIDYEGCLGLIRIYDQPAFHLGDQPFIIKVFVMEDYVNQVWREDEINLEQIIDPTAISDSYCLPRYSASGLHNGKLLLERCCKNECYYYDFKIRSFEQCDTPPRRLRFKESLISAGSILFGDT